MNLSIIIVNYNVKYFLKQCLQSVFKAQKNLQIEVFVVDNFSTDGSIDMLQQEFSQKIILIENKENVGFAKANNQAISLAQGKYILLLNPDTLVEEQTLERVVQFMEQTQDAGALGVKMIDGKGHYLPESKRGLPSPATAFYKIFGLSKLFPKSPTFNKYYLGYLSENENHAVEVLSGAFMLLRKSLLDNIGNLDEAFFMYGEDIDLSYRVIKAGFKNYYLSDTQIIHYKGESTKKDSIRYVVVFYQAMLIFAQKHFSKGALAQLLMLFIRWAIYFRALTAIVVRFIHRYLLILIDVLFLAAYIPLLALAYQNYTQVIYPPFSSISLVCYGIVWICGNLFLNSYQRPIKIWKTIQNTIFATAIILLIYSILPEYYRFSRAIIILGGLGFAFFIYPSRTLLHYLKLPGLRLYKAHQRRIAIVGTLEEVEKISVQLKSISLQKPEYVAWINAEREDVSQNSPFVADIYKLKEVAHSFAINEVIYCAQSLPSAKIIELMRQMEEYDAEQKIAYLDQKYMIGSQSIHSLNQIHIQEFSQENHGVFLHKKRQNDLIITITLLLLSPFLVWFQKNFISFYKNIFQVLSHQKTWVGFKQAHLLKPGIIELNEQDSWAENYYISQYTANRDWQILSIHWRALGNS